VQVEQPTPRDDLDNLLDFLLSAAIELLEKHHEFFPIAAQVTREGELEAVGFVDLDEERPASADVIDALGESMRPTAAAGEIRASGLCVDVRVDFEGFSDAVEVRLEHAEHEPVAVLMPYRRKRLGGYEYGDLARVEPRPPEVFVSTA